jgi:hypothetical protein
MNVPRYYTYYFRIAIILIVSAGFLLISLYVRSWMEHNIFSVCFPTWYSAPGSGDGWEGSSPLPFSRSARLTFTCHPPDLP